MGWLVVFSVWAYGDPSGMSGIECILDGVSKGTQENGKAEFSVTTRSHTYEVVIPDGYYFIDGQMTMQPSVESSGSFDIIEVWPEDDPSKPWEIWIVLGEEGAEEPPTDEEKRDFLGKVGAIVGSIVFVGMLYDSARKR